MATIISIMVLAVMALVAGAIYLWRRGAARLQIVLMLVVALVIVANIVIWAVPIGDSAPIMQQVPR